MKYINVIAVLVAVIFTYFYIVTKNHYFIIPMAFGNGWCLGIFLSQLKGSDGEK